MSWNHVGIETKCPQKPLVLALACYRNQVTGWMRLSRCFCVHNLKLIILIPSDPPITVIDPPHPAERVLPPRWAVGSVQGQVVPNHQFNRFLLWNTFKTFFFIPSPPSLAMTAITLKNCCVILASVDPRRLSSDRTDNCCFNRASWPSRFAKVPGTRLEFSRESLGMAGVPGIIIYLADTHGTFLLLFLLLLSDLPHPVATCVACHRLAILRSKICHHFHQFSSFNH